MERTEYKKKLDLHNKISPTPQQIRVFYGPLSYNI